MFGALNHKCRDCFWYFALIYRVVSVDRAISLRDTAKFIIVTLRLFDKFIISLLFHRGEAMGGDAGDVVFVITSNSRWSGAVLPGCSGVALGKRRSAA